MSDINVDSQQPQEADCSQQPQEEQDFWTNLLLGKTKACKHSGSWLLNAALGFIKNYVSGYGVKLGGQILLMMLKRKIAIKKIIKNLISKDSFYFSSFLAMICFLYKLSLWIMRRLDVTSGKYNAVVAGLIASLAAFWDKNHRRRELFILYLFSRTVESFFKVMDSHKFLDEPKEWGFYVFLWGSVFYPYIYFWEIDASIPDQKKIYDMWSAAKPNEDIIRTIFWRVGL